MLPAFLLKFMCVLYGTRELGAKGRALGIRQDT